MEQTNHNHNITEASHTSNVNSQKQREGVPPLIPGPSDNSMNMNAAMNLTGHPPVPAAATAAHPLPPGNPNMNTGGPVMNWSPPEPIFAPFLTVPLRTQVSANFGGDACSGAVIRIPAREVQKGGLAVYAVAVRIRGVPEPAAANQNHSYAPDQKVDIGAFANWLEGFAAKKKAKGKANGNTNAHANPLPVLAFPSGVPAQLASGNTNMNMNTNNKNPISGPSALHVHHGVNDNHHHQKISQKPNPGTVPRPRPRLRFTFRLEAVHTLDSFAQWSLALSGLRFKNPGHWQVTLRGVRKDKTAWKINGGVVKVVNPPLRTPPPPPQPGPFKSWQGWE